MLIVQQQTYQQSYHKAYVQILNISVPIFKEMPIKLKFKN